MAYTKEEIKRERERRNALKAGIKDQDESYQDDDIGQYEKYLKPFGAGVLQGTVNTGISALNLAHKGGPLSMAFGGKDIPHLKLGDKLDPEHSRIAELAGEIVAPAGILGPSIKALNKAPTLYKGMRGFAEKGARNAALGYTLGEQENEEGEHYGRGLAATLSAGIPAIASITNKAVGNKVINKFNKDKGELKEGYKKLFETAKDKGVDSVKSVISDKEMQDWIKGIPKNYRKSIEKFYNNSTLENAHKAQSDMGAYMRELQNAKEIKGTLPDYLNERLEKLQNKREAIKESITDALFDNKKTSGLGWKYMDLTGDWQEKLGPFLDVQDINKAVAGHIDPSTLAKSLQSKANYPFRQKMGQEFPELELNRLSNKYVWNRYGALGGGAGGLGIYGLISALDKGK